MRLWGGRFSEENDPRVADFTRSIEVDRELAARRPGRLDRPRPRARPGRAADRRRGDGARRRPRRAARRGRSGHARLGSGARGRPPQPRGGPGGADRRRSPASSTPAARATTRSPRTCASGCAGRDRPARRRPSSGSSARSSAWPSAMATRSCPARPTSSPPSRSCSPITCWPTSRCSSATAAGWPTARRRANVSPLGAGALAGAGYPLDREATARELGFDGVTANSLDAVERPRLRGRVPRRGRARDGPPQPARRGDHLVVEPAASASSAWPTRSRPARR